MTETRENRTRLSVHLSFRVQASLKRHSLWLLPRVRALLI